MPQTHLDNDAWCARFNYMSGAEQKLAKRGWSVHVLCEDTLALRTQKGAGSLLQDYHWRLTEEADWKNFRAFVRAEMRPQ